MSENIFKTKIKIPPSVKLGKEFTASGANTILALVGYGIHQFKIDEHSVKSTIFKWLESINFSLKAWNDARNEIGLVSPKSRTKLDLAMQDIVDNFDFDKTFIIHPDDYCLIPGLSSAVLTLNLTAFSSTGSKKPEVKSTAKKVSFSNILKKSSGPIKGSRNLKIGITPKDLFLHLNLKKGGSTQPLEKLLSTKKSISSVKFTQLTETAKFTTFQIALKVDVGDSEFWRRETFWPSGSVVSLW